MKSMKKILCLFLGCVLFISCYDEGKIKPSEEPELIYGKYTFAILSLAGNSSFTAELTIKGTPNAVFRSIPSLLYGCANVFINNK